MGNAVQSAQDFGKTLLLAAGNAAETMLASVEASTIADVPAVEKNVIPTLLEFIPAFGRGIAAGFIDSILAKGTPHLDDTIKSLFGIAMLRINALTGAAMPAGYVAPAARPPTAGTIDPKTGHPWGAINPATGAAYPPVA